LKELFFRKTVDQSLLKSGLTIPKELQNKLLESIGVALSKGEKETIRVLINGNEYEATLTNVNFSEGVTDREVIQIRYSTGSPICQVLNKVFARSAAYIMQKGTDGKAGIIPDDQKECVEVYVTDVKTLEFECHPIMKTMKEEFLKYLGSARDLSGYQRSYKLVFYKSFFERLSDSGDVAAYTTTRAFQQYYIDRKQAGLVPDANVDPIIENVETSSPESVYGLILRNPFDAISKHGFISKVSKNGKDYFQLNDALVQELSARDIQEILDIVNQKLEAYFSRIDPKRGADGKMRDFIETILNDYIVAKQETFAGHPMGTYFRNDIPNAIYNTGIVKSSTHLITGSVGQGNWATVPWVCIFDRNITTSATKGVYIVYLLSKDGQTLYLTFNQGCTDIRKVNSKKETIKIMREKAAEIISSIDSRGFRSDEDVNLGDGLTELAELYQRGIIFYKAYRKGAVPAEDELQSDLRKMMDIYSDYVSGTSSVDEWWPSLEEYNPGITKEKWLELLNTPAIFTESALKMIAEFYAFGGTATCAQLAEHYQRTYNYYLMTSVHLAERVVKATGCPVVQEEKNAQNAKWWPVLYIGKDASKDEKGSYIWKIRAELYEALKEFGIEKYIAKSGEEELSVKDTITNIKNYIAAKGFSYEDGMIENFYLSLKSKPFIILAGTSGTGKTRLVKLFAEAVGATADNGRYKMVSVRPDWSDSSDLLGHVNLNGEFVPGAIIDFVKKAEIDRNYPYFLCLDEMNLARVEYYLSDILSVIETREFVGISIHSDPLVSDTYYGSDTDAADRYGTVRLPENLYIIGTVNMDETTFPFSRKVLDRANTIEFSYVDLMPDFDAFSQDELQAMNLKNSFLKTEYLLLKQCTEEKEAVNNYCLELQKINQVLQKASAHVGYRVRDEIVFYLLNNKKYDLIAENEAMDNELMQKILPRIQGSSTSVKNMLCELFKICAGDYDGYQAQSDNISDKMKKALKDTERTIKYRHSAEKIELMTRRFEEDGFTSYWL